MAPRSSGCGADSELIFDAAYYTQNLPNSIEAVFYLDDNCGDAYDGPKCKDYGIGAQRAIARHFGLSVSHLPLLKLDLWNWDAPFTNMLAPPASRMLTLTLASARAHEQARREAKRQLDERDRERGASDRSLSHLWRDAWR